MTATATAPALPKTFTTGEAGPRLAPQVMMGVLAAVGVLVMAASALFVVLRSPSRTTAACSPVKPCPVPEGPRPRGHAVAWQSAALGIGLQYDAGTWRRGSSDADTLELLGAGSALRIRGSRDRDADSLFADEVDDLKRDVPDLARDAGWRQIRGANLGYTRGIAGVYCGTITTPQGENRRITVTIMAASRNRTSAVATVVTNDCGGEAAFGSHTLQAADSLLNTFAWSRR